MTLIVLAASLIVTCGLLAVMSVMYVQVKSVCSSQQQELASMQDEYNNADVITLNGQIVTPAEAMSLVRKYGSSVTIKVNGGAPEGGTSKLTRSSFGSGSQWKVVTSDSTGNGAYDTIDFVSLSDSNSPTTLDAARERLTSILDINTGSSWETILSNVDNIKSSNDYKIKIADLIGSSEASTWATLYTDLTEYLNQSGDTSSSVPYEMVSVNAGASASYSIISPVRGIAEDTSGASSALTFNGDASCSVVGGISSTTLTVNPGTSTITNSGTKRITVYLYSE
jgi:hypothetical protein